MLKLAVEGDEGIGTRAYHIVVSWLQLGVLPERAQLFPRLENGLGGSKRQICHAWVAAKGAPPATTPVKDLILDLTEGLAMRSPFRIAVGPAAVIMDMKTPGLLARQC